MLKTMRKNVKALKPALWIVVATFVISIFVVWGGAGRLGEGGRTGAMVQVGKEKITSDAYINALRNRIESLKSQFQELNRAFLEQLNVPQQVLEQIVEQALLTTLAKEMRIRASAAEVRDRILTLPGLQREGKFIGYDEYKRVLAYNRINVGQFESSLRQEVVLTKVVALLTAGVSVTPDEVWRSYKDAKDSAKIEVLALETSKVEAGPAADAAAVRAFFEANKDKYKVPEKRQGLAVLIKTEDLKKEIELSESEIEKYYNDNKAQFEIPGSTKAGRIWLPFTAQDQAQVEAQAKALAARLGKGEDFAGLAKAFSKDAKAQEGGDYGNYDWTTLPAAEQDAIKKLEAGRVSDPIQEADGFALVKVTEKTAAATTPLGEAKPRIRNVLLDQRSRDLAAERMAKLEKEARKAKSLEAAAKAANLTAVSTGLLKSGEAFGDSDPSGVVSTALFGLKDKELSTLLYAFGGVGLAELGKVEAPRPAAFDEVKTDVESDVAANRKKDKALAVMKEVKAKLTDKNWEDVAAKYKLELKTVDEHKREQYISVVGESKDIDALAFALPLKQISDPVGFATGTAIVRVLDRKEGTKEEFEKTRETETAAVLEQKKNKFLQAYLAKMRTDRNVKIRYDQFLQATQDVLSRYDTGTPGLGN